MSERKDLFYRIVAQIVTDIGFTGQYQLQGSGLSVVNLSGRKIIHKNEKPGLHAAAAAGQEGPCPKFCEYEACVG